MPPALRQLASLAAMLLVAPRAVAQTTPMSDGAPRPRPSFNLSAGATRGRDAPAATLAIGTDVPLSAWLGLRIEAGRRLPTSVTRMSYPLYSVADPSAPPGRRASMRPGTSIATERTAADVAVLARLTAHRGRRLELAGLAGVDLQVVHHRHRLTVPLSLTDPTDVRVYETANRRTRGLLDLGVDAGL